MAIRFVKLGSAAVVVCLAVSFSARAGLVQYWTFDETSGTTAANSVAGGNAGTLGNFTTPGWTTDVPAALTHSTGSLYFSNPTATPNRYVSFGDLGWFCGDQGFSAEPTIDHGYTLSMWIKPNTIGADSRLFGPLNNAAANTNPPTTRLATNQLQMWAPSNWFAMSPAASISTGQWQHLAITWVGSVAITYLNGVPTGVAKSATVPDLRGTNVCLARRFRDAYGTGYDGAIDDVAIWDTALLPSSVAALAAGVAPDAVFAGRNPLPNYGQIINIDFKHTVTVNDQPFELPPYQGHGAIAQAGTTWNAPSITGENYDARITLVDAVDSNGAATGIDFYCSGFEFGWIKTTGLANPLFSDRLISHADAMNEWQIDGLEVGTTYDLFFYGYGESTVNVTAGADAASASFLAAGTDARFMLQEDAPEDWVENIHFARITVTAESSTINGTVRPTRNVDLRNGFAGIQIAKHASTAPHAGDANGDGKVDDLDASILAANWQRTGGATWAQADFNNDGNVNDLDASILAANWQYGVGAAVPEPSTFALLAGLAGLGLVRWLRSRGRIAAILAATVLACSAATARAGLVQYWTFDETYGLTAANSVPSGNIGMLTGFLGDEWSADKPAALGHSTGSLKFIAEYAEYVNLGNLNMTTVAGSANVEGVTLSLWLNPTTWDGDTRVFGPYDDDDLSALTVRLNGPAGQPEVYLPSLGGWRALSPANSVQLGAWQHLALTWRNNNVIAYVNGVARGTIANVPFDFVSGAVNVEACLGARFRNQYGTHFNGLMDDVAIWDTALSPAAVAQLASGVAPTNVTGGMPVLPTYDQIVNVDFKIGNLPDYAGRGVIAQAGTTWNQPTIGGARFNAGTTLTNAVDGNGAATTIDVACSGFEFAYGAGPGYTNANALFDDRLHAHVDADNQWQIGGLEVGRPYDLFFYGYNEGTVSVTAGAAPTSANFQLDGNTRRFAVTNDVPEDWIEGLTFVRMTVTPTSPTISGVFAPSPEGSVGMGWAGLQVARIAPLATVPEPSVLVGLVGLLITWWVGRRVRR